MALALLNNHNLPKPPMFQGFVGGSLSVYPFFRALFVVACIFPLMVACGGGGGGGGTPDTTPPTVAPGSPTANQTDVSRNTTVTAVFNEPMNSGTINTSTFTLEDNIGTPVAGAVSYSGVTATFTPAAQLDQNITYTATVTTGAQDAAGNPLASDVSWSFTVEIDTAAPTVNPGTPTAAETNVDWNTTVTAVFNEPMNGATINASTFTLEDNIGTPVAGVVSYSGVTATFTPAAQLDQNITYTATVTTGAQDTAGNPLASDMSWSFTTAVIYIQVSWNAGPETAVNRSGGGHKVYYSTNSGFNPGDGGVTEVDVPYSSGVSAPTSIQIEMDHGTYYIRIVAYSALNAPGTSGGSISTATPQVTLIVP